MATLILVDGSEREVNPAGKKFTLAEMYALLGCETVEHVGLHKPQAHAWVDEEGKCKARPFNARATAITRERARLDPSDFIVGPVLITGAGEV